MSAIVLLTNPIDSSETERLREHAQVRVASSLDPQVLAKEIRDADVLIVRSPVAAEVLAHADRLRGIVRHGAGVDIVPVAQATARAIPVSNAPGANAVAVAEYVVGQMLLLSRRLHTVDALLRSDGWSASRALSDGAIELHGKTVGIIGVGAIGQALARICHYGFGMSVIGNRRDPSKMPDYIGAASIDDIFRTADFVVLACPLTAETKGLANQRTLGLMKQGASIINVARGAVINQADLVDVLVQQKISAALDVFELQPLPDDSPLRTMTNVILSSHIAGITLESMRRISELSVNQTLDLLAGKLPTPLVNPEVTQRALERMEMLKTSF
ncbi:NAD(P)-dependent oxidoreductase [Advenella sp. FME57]|uniref:NAD(P)-dependent oxidoreductase n=1 Tax=Advenella sp. FME57 TaxID=2742604 RepID=UPI001868D3F0